VPKSREDVGVSTDIRRAGGGNGSAPKQPRKSLRVRLKNITKPTSIAIIS
jgi:hypothetical protein